MSDTGMGEEERDRKILRVVTEIMEESAEKLYSKLVRDQNMDGAEVVSRLNELGFYDLAEEFEEYLEGDD